MSLKNLKIGQSKIFATMSDDEILNEIIWKMLDKISFTHNPERFIDSVQMELKKRKVKTKYHRGDIVGATRALL